MQVAFAANDFLVFLGVEDLHFVKLTMNIREVDFCLDLGAELNG